MVRLLTRSRLLSALAAVLIIHFIITTRFGAKSLGNSFPEYIANFRQKRFHSEESVIADIWDFRNIATNRITDAKRTRKSCFDDNINWDEKVEPKYKMDPDKFLIPSLKNGPNNQMMGFQQSILLALILNRTLVMPTFFEHQLRTVRFRRSVPSEYRLDISKLRKFISVVPNSEAVKACNSRLDGIFSSKGRERVVFSLSKLVPIYMETGLSGFEFVEGVGDDEVDTLKRYLYENEDVDDEKIIQQPWWPNGRDDFSWTWKIMKSTDPIIPIFPSADDEQSVKLANAKNAYNTDRRCILYWTPFREFQFKKEFSGVTPKKTGKFNIDDLSLATGWDLYADILLHSIPPRSVTEWAKQFRQEVFGAKKTEYIAVHWRFDDEDLVEYLCKNKKGRGEFCANVKRATNVTAIAAGIIRRITEVSSEYQKTIKAVYFAAPPTLKTLIKGVKRALTNQKAFRSIVKNIRTDGEIRRPTFFSAEDIRHFLLRKYRGCPMTAGRQLEDTISQIEMDMCEHSFSFMWSRQSTWSITARIHRYLNLGPIHRRIDVSSLDYALKSINNEE